MKPTASLASVLLGVVSLAHLLRIVFGTQVTIADRVIPMWISWIGFLVAGAIAIMLWRETRKKS